jgi:glycerol-3-phosphate responsive antiterminator
MEIRKITFTDSKNTENTVIDTNENISSFLETFRLEVDEVIELNDAMYTVKSISEKEIDAKKEILVDVEFIDLIENQPTA